MTDSEATACDVCGLKPARFIKLREITSLVLIWKQKSSGGNLCPVCAEAAYQRATRLTGRLGWWGPLPFIASLITLFTNFRAIKNHRDWLPHFKDAEGRLTNRPHYKLTHDNLTLALSVLAIGAFTLIGMNQFAGTRIGPISLDANAESGTNQVDWESVSVGDCLQSTGGLAVEITDCTSPHHWQVFEQVESSTDTYDVDKISKEGDKLCTETQTNLDPTTTEALTLSIYFPSSPAWDQGDRTITCLIGSHDKSFEESFIKP